MDSFVFPSITIDESLPEGVIGIRDGSQQLLYDLKTGLMAKTEEELQRLWAMDLIEKRKVWCVHDPGSGVWSYRYGNFDDENDEGVEFLRGTIWVEGNGIGWRVETMKPSSSFSSSAG